MEWFNPRSARQAIDLGGGRNVLVIDDALLDPESLVAWASERAALFQPVDFSKYPGVWHEAPEGLPAALEDVFQQRARRLFDARRCLDAHIRLSMVTLPAQSLRPRQWLCHVDDFLLPRTESMVASVLYLYRDVALGGTGFYEPVRPAAETEALLKDADTLAPAEFTRRHGISPGYLHASNEWFRRIGGIEPRWNRLVFYDGGIRHAAEVPDASRLSADPAVGRLTLNSFFTCRRNLA